jgi:beta-fructofuranosidase
LPSCERFEVEVEKSSLHVIPEGFKNSNNKTTMQLKTLIPILFFSIFTVASVSAQLLFHLDFEEGSGTTTTEEQINGTTFNINNHFNRPERINGVVGAALRMDGWSTYIHESDFSLNGISNQMTIEAWYATECFTKESAAIIELSVLDAGFYLSVSPFGELNFSYHLDGNTFLHNTSNRLTTYQWHHIVAVINLDENYTSIFVDNELWLTSANANNNTITTAAGNLFVGKRALNQTFDIFSTNTLNGALADVKIYANALTATEIADHFNAFGNPAADLAIDPAVRHEGDYLRPQYHPMPNTVWTNEPYGLTYWNGQYHLFFQKNPNGPYLHFMHWGHLSSPDLVTWTEEDVMLRPDPGWDDFGIWSGATTFDQNGNPVIFYTGVDGQKAGIGSAHYLDDDLIRWEKTAGNPHIPNPPSGFNHMDFRDPFLFKEGDWWYLIVGSGIANETGGILFSYKSMDLINWETISPIFNHTDVIKHGIFWEMPSFFELEEDKYMLNITPVPVPGKKADALYWIGSFVNEDFVPTQENAFNLELFGEHLLAPAFGKDENQQHTYIGIIPEDRSVATQVAAGWRQTFSLPRVIRLLEDEVHVGQVPHPNLCRLRGNETSVNNRTIQPNSNFNLPEYSGNQSELYFKIYAPADNEFRIQVFKNEAATAFTAIRFDKENNRILLDRTNSSPYDTEEDIRFGNYTFNSNDSIEVRIFIDHSVLEVFVDELVVFSARVYPGEESDKIDLVTLDSAIVLVEYKAWDLGAKEMNYPDITCLPENLPPDLYTGITAYLQKHNLKVYPNPAVDFIQLEGDHTLDSIRISDLQGKLVFQQYTSAGDKIDVSDLPKGAYVLEIWIRGEQDALLFVKE